MTKQFLKNNDLRAVPYDKGIGYCIMTNKAYEDKLDPIIELPQFKPVTDARKNAKNIILKEEERVVSVLSNLKKCGKISQSLFVEL